MMGEVAIFGEQPLGQAACRRNIGGITRRQGVDFDAFCFIFGAPAREARVASIFWRLQNAFSKTEDAVNVKESLPPD